MTGETDGPLSAAEKTTRHNSDEAALNCGGRLFHARAAGTGNARSPLAKGYPLSRRHQQRRCVGTRQTVDGDDL